jgi:hypothetical protein
MGVFKAINVNETYGGRRSIWSEWLVQTVQWRCFPIINFRPAAKSFCAALNGDRKGRKLPVKEPLTVEGDRGRRSEALTRRVGFIVCLRGSLKAIFELTPKRG